jgi:hypothetical protein
LSSACNGIADRHGFEFVPTRSHGLWAWWFVIAVPSAKASGDPGEPSERTGRMRVLLARRFALKRRANGFGRTNEIFIGDVQRRTRNENQRFCGNWQCCKQCPGRSQFAPDKEGFLAFAKELHSDLAYQIIKNSEQLTRVVRLAVAAISTEVERGEIPPLSGAEPPNLPTRACLTRRSNVPALPFWVGVHRGFEGMRNRSRRRGSKVCY